jgi:hypothetical protein
MPYKRKKVFKRRAFRKTKRAYKKKKYTNRLTVKGPGLGIPNRLFNVLKYAERLQLNPGALTHYYAYNANSVYDPNRTGVGHQPMYHDQMVVLYNRYRVRGFAYEIIISNLNTPATVVVSLTNGSVGPLSATDASENPYSKQAIVNTMANGGGSVRKFKGYVSLKTILGENITDDRDQAQSGYSPSNTVLLAIQTETLDGATNITSLNIYVKLKYYTEWFDRHTVVGS